MGCGRLTKAVTTWSLELTDPARLAPPTRPPGRTLRLERTTVSGTSERFYRAVGAGWQWNDRAGWTPGEWASWESRVETHVAYADGVEAGYVELDPAGLPDSVEIAYLGLLPGFDGHGLGGHLLTYALRRGFELAPRVWVHTCSLDGPHALANYETRGMARFRTEVSPR